MQIDPESLPIRDLYGWMVQLITPRPIAWVSTLSATDIPNLAPYSFFNGVGANPPTLVFCPANNRFGEAKDTLANIRHTGEFVVNVVTEEWAMQMNATAAEFNSDVDEFDAASVTRTPSSKVAPYRVQGCKAAFECRLLQTMSLGHGPGGANLVIGRIVCIHVADSLLSVDGEFVSERLDTIGRLGGNGYSRTSDRFDLPRPKRPN